MKKMFAVVMVLLVVSSLCLASYGDGANKESGIKFSFKYENYSWDSTMMSDTKLVSVHRYDWTMDDKLQSINGRNSTSRILFNVGYDFPNVQVSAIFGLGNLSYKYWDGQIVRKETYENWSGKFESQHNFVPFQNKSNLGLIYGGELDWAIKPEPFSVHFVARYLRQEQSTTDSNMFSAFTEGTAWMQYGYSKGQANICKASYSEVVVGVDISQRICNWKFSIGPKAVILNTVLRGTGSYESKFWNFYYESFDSFKSENDFKLEFVEQGFLLSWHIGYEINFAEMFVEGRVGFANGISAGLSFKMF